MRSVLSRDLIETNRVGSLGPVYGWFNGFDTLDLKEAKALREVICSWLTHLLTFQGYLADAFERAKSHSRKQCILCPAGGFGAAISQLRYDQSFPKPPQALAATPLFR